MMFGRTNNLKTEKNNDIVIKKGHRHNFLLRFFFNYGETDKKFLSSGIYRFFSTLKGKLSGIGRFKQKIAELTEESIICKFFSDIPSFLFSAPLRSYGILAFFYGIFNLATDLFVLLRHGYYEASEILKILIGAFIILSMSGLLSSSHKSLGTSIVNSRIMSFILFNILCFDAKKTEYPTVKHCNNSVYVITGACLGIIFAILPQRYLAFLLILAVMFHAVIVEPESGIILSFILLPFAGEDLLLFAVMLCVFAVFLKVLRNKRVMKVLAVDIVVFLFILLVLLSGINCVGGFYGVSSSFRIILFLIFGWILNNTIRTTVLAEKCVKALVHSTSVIAVIGILIFLFDIYDLDSKAMTLEIFGSFLRSIPFSSDSSCAELVVLVIPFAYSLQKSDKLYGYVSSLVLVIYALLSMDFSIWVTLLFVSIVYVCIRSPGLFLYFGIVIALLFAIDVFVPDLFSSIKNIIENLSDRSELFGLIQSSNEYGIKAIHEFWYAGAGSGNHVIGHVFSCLFGSDISAYSQNTSMFIGLIMNYGIVGFILVFCMYLLFTSNCLSLFYKDKFCKPSLRLGIVSCFASCTGVFFKAFVFSSGMSSNFLLGVILIFYLSFSFRKSSLIEYTPDMHEQLYLDGNA